MYSSFLLGQYCSSDDEDVIKQGVANVKRILADNFVRPDEAQKVLSLLRARGSYTIIDKVTVQLNIKKDCYEAEFSNLGLKNIPLATSTRRSTTACSAAASGASFSLPTRARRHSPPRTRSCAKRAGGGRKVRPFRS